MPFKGTPTLLDAFTRADVGPPPSANYTSTHTTGGTGHKVVSNTVRGNTTGASHSSRWSASTFPADQYVGLRIVASQGTGNDIAVDLRIQNIAAGATDLIRVRHWRRAADDDVQASIILDGSNATARTGSLFTKDFALNDVLLAEVIGDQLLIYRQLAAGGDFNLVGTVLVPATIGQVASNIGFYNWQSSTTAPTLDDLLGGASNGHDQPIVVAGVLNSAQATTVVPVVPVHTDNDVLFCYATANVGSDLSISAGWTAVDAPVNDADCSHALWWRRVGAGETVTNPTVTQSVAGSATNAVTALVVRARGCRTSGLPFETYSRSVTSTTTNNAFVQGITSIANNVAQLQFVTFDGATSAWATTAGAGAPPIPDSVGLVTDQTTTQGADCRIVVGVRELGAAGFYAATDFGFLTTTPTQQNWSVGLVPQPAEVATAGEVTSVATVSGTSNTILPVSTSGMVTSVAEITGVSGTFWPQGDATSRAEITGVSGVTTPPGPVGIALSALWDVRSLVPETSILQWDQRANVGTTKIGLWSQRTTVGGTRVAVWNLRALVGNSDIALWNISSPANVTRTALWNDVAIVGATRALVWNDSAYIGVTRSLLWHNLVQAGLTRILRWDVRASAAKQSVMLWNGRAVVSQTDSLLWNLRAGVSENTQLVWNDAASVGQTRTGLWNLLNTVGGIRTGLWNVSSSGVGLTQALLWNNSIVVGKSNIALWSLRAPAEATITTLWEVLQSGAVGEDTSLRWALRAAVADTWALLWNNTVPVTRSRTALWDIRAAAGATHVVRWNQNSLVPVVPHTIVWNLRNTQGIARTGLWNLRSGATKTISINWDENSSAIPTVRSLVWSMRSHVDRTWTARWAQMVTADTAQSVVWSLKATTGISHNLVWPLHALAATQRVVTWRQDGTVAAQRFVRWGQNVTTGVTRDLTWTAASEAVGNSWNISWASVGPVAVEGTTRWEVRVIPAYGTFIKVQAGFRTRGVRSSRGRRARRLLP